VGMAVASVVVVVAAAVPALAMVTAMALMEAGRETE
jgi:hypothetical protein